MTKGGAESNRSSARATGPTAGEALRWYREPLDRRGTSATKWEKYGPDVLPFWVADMDLPTPEVILDAVRKRLTHPLLGYTNVPTSLSEAFCSWAEAQFGWRIQPSWLVWIPGVVAGLNVAARAATAPGDPVFVMPPVYYPFLSVPEQAAGQRVDVPLLDAAGTMDLERLEVQAATGTRSGTPAALLLCNPQNPTGRCYSHDELRTLAECCERQNLIIISDEIHCDLLLDPTARHQPIAALDERIAARSITLMAPTKTYNMPALGCAVAVIPNPRLRQAFRDARIGMVGTPSVLGYAAAEAAYRQEGDWIATLCTHLRRNQAQLAAVAGERMHLSQATYLGWINVSDLESRDVSAHFLKHGLGLSWGDAFGAPGFVRFNFACATEQLERGLARLDQALNAI